MASRLALLTLEELYRSLSRPIEWPFLSAIVCCNPIGSIMTALDDRSAVVLVAAEPPQAATVVAEAQ